MSTATHLLVLLTLALATSAAVLGEGCECSDVRPRVGTGATHAERFSASKTCAEHRAEGNCQAAWMKTGTAKEIASDGFCMITCGHCACCAPVATTLKRAGLTALLEAAKGTPYEKEFEDPAFMAVVLAPRAGPITDINAHILPPVAEWGNATYTAALLAGEQSVQTEGGKRLPVSTGGGATQVGRARLVQGDMQACKAVVHVVDAAVA